MEVERWIDARLAGKPVAPPPAAVGIGDVFAADRVLFLEKARKPEVLNALIDCLSSLPNAPGRAELAREILLREELMSTGMGLGVAIPHVRLASLDRTLMAAAVVRKGVPDYESMDGQPVRLVFMIAAGHHQHGEYLRLLSSLANLVKDEGFARVLSMRRTVRRFFRCCSEARFARRPG